ncbi:hypothetical protein ACH41E_20660 [Streptomyces sp. NPDC020412]|uniref:hypothetical protein n=1 Tax=Streptomyces sp. NPDC020412 TaxID=3365073 RepID=UPI00379BBD81
MPSAYSALRTKAAVASAFLAGTMLLSACGSDTKDGAGAKGSDKSAAQAEGDAAKADGVSGTFAGGTISYLAPGKHVVTADGKDQQFLVAAETEVLGAGAICGAYNSRATNDCTVEDLEKAVKKGSLTADVVMKDGIAVKVTERPKAGGGPSDGDGGGDAPTAPGQDKGTDKATGGNKGTDKGKGSSGTPGTNGGTDGSANGGNGGNTGGGVNGTWFGNVTFVAPGKYAISGAKNESQLFYLAVDTKIWGAGDICGDEQGQSATLCTEAQLEAVAKNGGVSAEVVIANGNAVKITDDR